MREVIGSYKNGNYTVVILSDGTMIRSCKDDIMIPEFPDSMDIKLTNRCSGGTNCKYCHENSSPDGLHGKILNVQLLNSLKPYTQLAVGGGNVLEHPDFLPFLIWCKERKLIPSITLNQKHFMDNLQLIKDLADKKLIYGIGVSLIYPTDELINAVREFPNAVIHVISGIVSKTELDRISDRGLKVLVLGYKQFRRGDDFYKSSPETQRRIDTNINWLKDNLSEIAPHFDKISFDNLAIKQLNVRSLMNDDAWKRFYMGDDGQFTMYVDTVNEEFAVSSTSRKRFKYTDSMSIEDIFKIVRSEIA